MILSRDVTSYQRARGASNTHASFSESTIFQYCVITVYTDGVRACIYTCISVTSLRFFDMMSFAIYHMRFYILYIDFLSGLYQRNAMDVLIFTASTENL